MELLQGVEDQQGFKESAVANSKLKILKQLKKVISVRLNALEIRSDDFSDPSWAYKQAYDNGQRKQLKDLLNLLQFVEA